MASLIGKEIGKYRITERLGQGGMAEVYAGIHTHLDRKVAVKVLHSYLLEGGDFVARFKREAKAVANLRHPNIVQVYDFDIQDDLIFMVMEYVDGVNLHTKLVEMGNKRERMPIKLIGSIINDIASALDYAHSKGMLHRDIKPSNIMIDNDNKAFLTDFGIAKLLSDQKFTATGTLVGTPAYMSPEQGRGDDLTEESDIYSLGVIAFEMLTGQVPYDAKTPIGIVHKQINDPVPNMNDLVDGMPGTAQEVIDRALAKTPGSRFSSAEALVGALRTALQALESTDPIAIPADESPTLVDDVLEAPTVTMKAEEMEQPTVVMEKEKKIEKPPAKEPKKKAPKEKQAVPKPKGEKKKIPLWGYIAGGVALVAVAVVLITQVFSPGSMRGSSGDGITASVDAAKGTDGVSILLVDDDGDFEYVTTGDQAGWRTGSGRPIFAENGNNADDFFLYFEIDDQLIHQLPPDAEVYIDVEYQDQGTDIFFINFDAHDGGPFNDGHYKESGHITKTDSGEVLTVRFELTNAFFGNRLSGADFRIYDNGDGVEIIHSVKVTYVPSEGGEQTEEGSDPSTAGESYNISGEEIFLQGEELIGQERPEEALDNFNRAIDAGYETGYLYHLRAWAFQMMGHMEESRDSWSRAIELEPENYEYWMERGWRKFDLGDLPGAIEDISEARNLAPGEWATQFSLGLIYYLSEEDQFKDESHEAFDQAIALEPNNPESRKWIAELKMQRFGDPASALEDLNIAVENSDPNDPGYISLRGEAYLQLGEWEPCIEDQTRAIEIDAGNPWYFLKRGDCFVGLGEVDPARADYEIFLELAGDDPWFIEPINNIQSWLNEN